MHSVLERTDVAGAVGAMAVAAGALGILSVDELAGRVIADVVAAFTGFLFGLNVACMQRGVEAQGRSLRLRWAPAHVAFAAGEWPGFYLAVCTLLVTAEARRVIPIHECISPDRTLHGGEGEVELAVRTRGVTLRTRRVGECLHVPAVVEVDRRARQRAVLGGEPQLEGGRLYLARRIGPELAARDGRRCERERSPRST
jgi:hypothetical protein